MSIESFNRRLNESATGSRWDDWASYRAALMNLMAGAIHRNGSGIIIGAGNIHDIDLIWLSEKIEAITLADIDIESVKKATVNFSGDIKILRMDIGNLETEGLFTKITNEPTALKATLDSHELITHTQDHKYDNIILSSVYTQLFIPQFLPLLGRSESLGEGTLETALAFSARLISHLNDTIIKLSEDDATIYAWSDILEYGVADPALTDIRNHIDDKKWMDSFYDAYIRDYGHGLGSFGIEDLAERLEKVRCSWLLWPFDTERIMIVKFISGKVTS